ncbi:MAG: exodeoxyribonuclease VII large subunit [Candidatus Marinimicrobia bacterium]|nr:exodeoxyribonuclease VII large subunit [Candidatus Neomarinimicrobiota bacterium]|tara:strand:+ start:591 stop:1802 length:1212 start_codon:yes stop_codon:yes gene_type:complete
MPEYRNYFSVSNLNSKIRYTLEGNLKGIGVKGELSNFHHHPSSGHMYFTLKDETSEIRCAMFRGNNLQLKFKPIDGMAVKLYGDVTFYEQRGSIQIKVSSMEPEGVGELYRAFQKLKETLGKEGLFDDKYKKPLPSYPHKIGIITSSSGAALKDILNVLERRAPHLKIILKSVKVQGQGAIEEIVQAIELFNIDNSVDALILGRGGGSLEDLWAFNEEAVVRSIFKCTIPIITGIGHETDFSIADFVSDVRAPTPSAAAEIVAPSKSSILKELNSIESQIINSMKTKVERLWINTDQFERSLAALQPQKIIKNNLEILSKLDRQMHFIIIQIVRRYGHNLESLLKRLINVGPDNVLKRGYSIPLDGNGKIIKTARQIKVGEIFNLKTAKGSLSAKKISDIINN